MRYSLTTLLFVCFLVALFLALRSMIGLQLGLPYIVKADTIPPILAACASLFFALRTRTFSAPIQAAAIVGLAAAVTLAVEIADSFRRSSQYLGWDVSGVERMLPGVILQHLIVAILIGLFVSVAILLFLRKPDRQL